MCLHEAVCVLESECGGGSVFRYPVRYGCRSGAIPDNPIVYTCGPQGGVHRYCEGSSRDGENLVFTQTQTDEPWLFAVEVKRPDRILNICSELFPIVALSNDVFAERFGDESAVTLLRNFKDEFAHTDTIR
jgi:hypothetical protein